MLPLTNWLLTDGDVKCDGTMVDASGTSSPMTGEAVSGDTLVINANLPYWGSWPTEITCTSSEFTLVSDVDATTAAASIHTYTYTITSVGSVTCTATLPASTSALIPADTVSADNKDGYFYATNIPSFTSTCATSITSLICEYLMWSWIDYFSTSSS